MTPPKIVVQIDDKTESALLRIAGERQVATSKQVSKSDIVREALRCYLDAHENGESIKSILTDWHDGQETLDGAVARIIALQR